MAGITQRLPYRQLSALHNARFHAIQREVLGGYILGDRLGLSELLQHIAGLILGRLQQFLALRSFLLGCRQRSVGLNCSHFGGCKVFLQLCNRECG